MTEDEYVLVGNLSRVRAAMSVLRDVMLPDDVFLSMWQALVAVEEALTEQVEAASPGVD